MRNKKTHDDKILRTPNSALTLAMRLFILPSNSREEIKQGIARVQEQLRRPERTRDGSGPKASI